MSKNIFFISDHHLGHDAIINFKNKDGSQVRNFSNINEMHDFIIYEHNNIVSKYDKVYFLGDVAIKKEALPILNKMNGKKRLILGNHDIFNDRKQYKINDQIFYINEYYQYFEEILSYKVFPDNFICSHIPLNKKSITERFCYNVHGHLHNNVVIDNEGFEDPYYFNVCCERLNFKPIEFSELNLILNSKFRSIEFQRRKI